MDSTGHGDLRDSQEELDSLDLPERQDRLVNKDSLAP